MQNFTNKVAVITGAASGIGRALAQELAARGCRLALSDIDQAGLDETAQLLALDDSRLRTYRVDCGERSDIEQFARQVEQDFGEVDIVINNAGVASMGAVESVDLSIFEQVINVNLWGVIHGSRAFLPMLRRRPQASLVNISSLNAMMPFPLNGPYNISKYGVYGLNETLMIELKNTSVQVMSVHPGGITTNIANNSLNSTEAARKKFNELTMRTSAEDAATAIIKGIQQRESYLFVGTDAKIMQFIKRVSPKLALAVANKVIEPVAALAGRAGKYQPD